MATAEQVLWDSRAEAIARAMDEASARGDRATSDRLVEELMGLGPRPRGRSVTNALADIWQEIARLRAQVERLERELAERMPV